MTVNLRDTTPTTTPTTTTTTTTTPTPTELRRALAAYPTGVIAVCARIGDDPVGMAVNSFTSISLEPPLVAISVARTSTTWPLLSGRRLGISVLSVDQEALCRQLSSRVADRFAGAEWQARDGGSVLISGAALWLECEARSVFDGGDHEIVVMEVLGAQSFPDVDPLVFHQSRFHVIHGVH
ncbi:flavin reductase family protein [Nocardioides astragali]|uniref:Flavin reductase family protein n=1 Tax=Nocardioides astragali TaxID=1776736 RepID=A0ABW2N0D8_9ACTN|nr:flavin reductase family protein [Nocardioides astragali]